MAIPGTTPVTASVAPSSVDDTYPTHDDSTELGGLRPVANVAERNTIPMPYRKEGMAVFVMSLNQLHVLGPDLVTWTQRA